MVYNNISLNLVHYTVKHWRFSPDQLRRKPVQQQRAVCGVSRDRASREGDDPGLEAVSGRVDSGVRRLSDVESPPTQEGDIRMYGRIAGGYRRRFG